MQGQSKDTKQLSLTLSFSMTRSKHNNNSIMFESPPSATVPTTNPPPSVAVHVSDADPMAGLTEAEKANARKKIARGRSNDERENCIEWIAVSPGQKQELRMIQNFH